MLLFLIPALVNCSLPVAPLEVAPLEGALRIAVVDRADAADSTRTRAFLHIDTEKVYGFAPYFIHACVAVDGRTITLIVAGVHPPTSGVDMPRNAEAEFELPPLSQGTYRVRVLGIGSRQDLTLRVTTTTYDLRGAGRLAIGQKRARTGPP